MVRIKRLPDDVIQRIAAGEVVERPLSAVKELIDNAIDASASEIRIEVRRGGLDYIGVQDNGVGIYPEDLPLSIERYTTSKISSSSDLDTITTMGFRGEALYAIRMASERLVISSRPKDLPVGYRIIARGEHVKGPTPIAMNFGTSVEVWNLFAPFPVRRGFIKSPAYEEKLIKEAVIRYAFSRPEIRFTYRGSRERFTAYGEDGFEELYRVLVGNRPQDMVTLKGEDGGLSASIAMFFDPAATNPFVFVSVNGRPVFTGKLVSMLKKLVSRRYERNFPSVHLWLWLPPSFVDPNIHPSKMEVDIKQWKKVWDLISNLLESFPTPRIKVSKNVTPPSKEEISTTPQRLFSPSEEEEAIRRGEIVAPDIIGVIDNTYILYRVGEDYKLADQHALMESILYHAFVGEKRVQQLLYPWTFRVDDPESIAELLRELRFDAEPMGPDHIVVRGIPALLTARFWTPEAMAEMLKSISLMNSKPSLLKLADIACKASIKAGQAVGRATLRYMLMLAEENPHFMYDPHGRPAILKLTPELLQKLFGR